MAEYTPRSHKINGLAACLYLSLDIKKAARGRPFGIKSDLSSQRISDVPALVTTTGLPAFITWVDWAVWA